MRHHESRESGRPHVVPRPYLLFVAILLTSLACSTAPEPEGTPGSEGAAAPTPASIETTPAGAASPAVPDDTAPLPTPLPEEAFAEEEPPDEMWLQDLIDADDARIEKLMKMPQDIPALDEKNAKDLDADSQGKYLTTQKKLSSCKSVPAEFVWREFAPFFDYKWNREFRDFLALFLAVWRRESYFTLPARGVHVTTNCGSIKSKIVRPLSGKSLKRDLALSRKKDRELQKAFGKCSIRAADFGPLQWNRKWRLGRGYYRSQTEKALMVSTRYSKSELRTLSNGEIGDLVKYNPQALFVLGGLSLREGARTPDKTIAEYNSDADYRRIVSGYRKQYVEMLDKDPACSPGADMRILEKKAQKKAAGAKKGKTTKLRK